MNGDETTLQWIATTEAARRLRVGDRRVMQLVRSESLAGEKDERGHWRIRADSVERHRQILDRKPSRQAVAREPRAGVREVVERLRQAVADLAVLIDG
jgi:excisionase family DNA binding protein